MGSHNRRSFFWNMAGLAAFPAAARSASRNSTASSRQQEALRIRQAAARWQGQQVAAEHPNNGDEAAYPNYIASFGKGLPHSQSGEVVASAYQSLLAALETGTVEALENIQRGSGSKFINPMSGFAFQMEGADSHVLGMAPPPPFASAESAGEMVELYWQALCRDVPFAQYDSSPLAAAAAQDLSRLSVFKGPAAGGHITTGTLFRGNVNGGLDGPFVSQFFVQPVPVNSTPTHQMYRQSAPGTDYLNSYDEWLVLQTGVPPYRDWVPDSQLRYIYNGRSLAEWVHYDFLYQAFHNAALILLNQSPDTVLDTNPYLNPTNPYKSTKVETGFATFGAPHICSILGTVTIAALYAAWYQKWMVHRRLRPEEFGGRLHQSKTGAAQYPIHADLMNSAALPMVYSTNTSYLLPQAFPEGCPLHPSYPSGHATVSGACSVMLKAFFDETEIVTNCVVPASDGLSLNPYTGPALTVGGEINKLAFNIAMGRNFAGIHYRSDAEDGFLLGEQVGMAILADMVDTYAEGFSGFRFTRLDGTPVSIGARS